MPIKSTKPRPGRFNPSPEPQVTQAQFMRGGQQLDRMLPQARRDVRAVNRMLMNMTQPYARAGELRAGGAFRRQQEAAIRAERV